MKTNRIAAVMVHAPNWREGFEWYANAFPCAERVKLPEFDFEYLNINGIHLEVVKSDEKVGSGAAGLAVDWFVEDFSEALEHLSSLGAVLYRGPMKIEGCLRMCKLKDPYGNLIGIRGP